MRIIDVHAHLYHPDWYPYLFQRQLAIHSLGRRKRSVDEGAIARELGQLNDVLTDRDGSICLHVMDKVGIEKRVVHVIDWGLELGEPVTAIHDVHKAVLAVCRTHSDRLIGFAGVDPRRKDAVWLVRWAVEEMGAAGLKLHPTSREWTLDDDRVAALMDVAFGYELPVMVHTGRTIDPLTDINCQPSALLRLATRFPQVNFIAGHSAFLRWSSFGPTPPANLWFDISAWQDRLSLDADVLKTDVMKLLTTFSRHVFFGTDSPFYGFNLPVLETKWVAFVRRCAEELGLEALNSVFSGRLFVGNGN
jgi:predicted TIM-barrel fold metal-dependent hydrolase